MTERKPFKVDDHAIWSGSQLEHPAESAGSTLPTMGLDDAADIEPDDPERRTYGGMLATIVLLTAAVLGLAALAYVAGVLR